MYRRRRTNIAIAILIGPLFYMGSARWLRFRGSSPFRLRFTHIRYMHIGRIHIGFRLLGTPTIIFDIGYLHTAYPHCR